MQKEKRAEIFERIKSSLENLEKDDPGFNYEELDSKQQSEHDAFRDGLINSAIDILEKYVVDKELDCSVEALIKGMENSYIRTAKILNES